MKIGPAELLTPANAATVAGLVLFADGLRRGGVTGMCEVVAARSLDVVDGALARQYGSSEFGAALDATVDKFFIGAVAVQTWRNDAIPKPVIGAVIAQNIANATATAIAQHRHPDAEQRPTKAGKWGMALVNAGIFSCLAGETIRDTHPRVSGAARTIGAAVTMLGIGIGSKATTAYIKRAL